MLSPGCRRGLPAELRRLAMGDLLTRDHKGHPTQHAATINKTPNILSAIVSRAEAAGSLDTVPGLKNPFGKGIKPVADARAEEKRQSDSGTIAEKAALLDLPAVPFRDTQERPEGMGEGRRFAGSGRDDQGGAVSIQVVRIVPSYTDPIDHTVWSDPGPF